MTGVRGHAYEKPVATMRAYLDAMEKAPYVGPKPAEEAPVVIAALRPKMLALARRADARRAPLLRAAGAHRAARARSSAPVRCSLPEQMVMLETDPTKARAVARAQR